MRLINLYRLLTHVHKHLPLPPSPFCFSPHVFTCTHTYTSTYFEEIIKDIMTALGIEVRMGIKEQITKQENDFAWPLMLVCQ